MRFADVQWCPEGLFADGGLAVGIGRANEMEVTFQGTFK
jgi:hypothetical protein